VYEKKRVFLFLDEELRHREETDYLNRIESKAQDYSIEKFHRKRHAYGTIGIYRKYRENVRRVMYLLKFFLFFGNNEYVF
jgi:hypothetical protein